MNTETYQYLNQARYLNWRIDATIKESAELRAIATSISSPVFGEHVQETKSGEAPFVRIVEKILLMEDKINSDIDCLFDLKEEIKEVINQLEDESEKMVLRYRYFSNMTWREIGETMHASERTVRRWHASAIDKIKLPEGHTIID